MTDAQILREAKSEYLDGRLVKKITDQKQYEQIRNGMYCEKSSVLGCYMTIVHDGGSTVMYYFM